MTYYNEFDRRKAAWLRELIAKGHIAKGEVDERSITEVAADDLRGFRQCHFFAGIGVWSYALRQAGWEDDREVWTGSCPCQSFSVAGNRLGFADERHLWPSWFRLIQERRPRVIFGEQSSSKDALAWIDLVQTDLESQDYACGALDLCAAGFGAPHIRQRLYFVADAGSKYGEVLLLERGPQHTGDNPDRRSGLNELGDASGAGLSVRECEAVLREGRRGQGRTTKQSGGSLSGVADADDAERRQETEGRGDDADRADAGRKEETSGPSVDCQSSWTGPTNGFWRDADWLHCTDGKWRPVKPGTSPLAHGAESRVGRLRGYGDAIVAEVAKAFIEAYMTCG